MLYWCNPGVVLWCIGVTLVLCGCRLCRVHHGAAVAKYLTGVQRERPELPGVCITQIYFNSSKYTFPVLALHKDRIGRDMNPSEFVY